MDCLLVRFNKKSYIVWCVVIIIAASTVLLGVTGGMNLAKTIENEGYIGTSLLHSFAFIAQGSITTARSSSYYFLPLFPHFHNVSSIIIG